MLKYTVLLEKRSDITHEEFAEYWEEEHAPLAFDLPGVKRYATAPVINPEEVPWDGVGELWFDSMDDMRSAFDNDLGREIREDEENFIDDILILPASETVQFDRT
ncbi:EthD family reductase [Halobacteriales archaeon Cl-PHB]